MFIFRAFFRASQLCLNRTIQFVFTAPFLVYLRNYLLNFIFLILALVRRHKNLGRIKGKVTFDEFLHLGSQSLFVVICDTKIICTVFILVRKLKTMHALIIPHIPIFLNEEKVRMFCLYDRDLFVPSPWFLPEQAGFTFLLRFSFFLFITILFLLLFLECKMELFGRN